MHDHQNNKYCENPESQENNYAKNIYSAASINDNFS
jgi:hypothetical protein